MAADEGETKPTVTPASEQARASAGYVRRRRIRSNNVATLCNVSSAPADVAPLSCDAVLVHPGANSFAAPVTGQSLGAILRSVRPSLYDSRVIHRHRPEARCPSSLSSERQTRECYAYWQFQGRTNQGLILIARK